MLDFVLHLFAQLLVEGAQGLVHQHQVGLEDQRPGDGDPLLLAARELGRAPPAEAGKLDHLQRLPDPPARLVARHATYFQGEEQVLLHRHVREQGVVLEHHADPALVRRDVVDRPAVEEDFAVGGRLEPRQHHQARRLARAGRPEHRQELPLGDVQIEALDDQGHPVVALLDVVEADVGGIRVGARGARDRRSGVGARVAHELCLDGSLNIGCNLRSGSSARHSANQGRHSTEALSVRVTRSTLPNSTHPTPGQRAEWRLGIIA